MQKEKKRMKTPVQEKPVPTATKGSADLTKLLEQYRCGPAQFTGTPDALYERHLLFDNGRRLTAAGARERFEAAARSLRDILSQQLRVLIPIFAVFGVLAVGFSTAAQPGIGARWGSAGSWLMVLVLGFLTMF